MTIGRHASRALVLATAAALTGATASTALAAGSETVAFSGAEQTVTVPANICRVTIDAFGAAGGDALYGGVGGKGAEVRTTVDVSAGQVLTVNVGGAGTGGTDSDPTARGGYNGGGRPGAYNDAPSAGNGATASGGGGATTVATTSGTLVIAGGGGGGGGSFIETEGGPGGAGGETGTSGSDNGAPTSGKGGASGGAGGTGGAGGVPQEAWDTPGFPGGAAVGTTGGAGALNVGDPHMGTGGGGGGGAHGGGAGGSSTAASTASGGGGGGSSLGPAGSTFTTGARAGDGEVSLEWHDCESPSPTPTPTPTDTPTPTPSATEPTSTPTPSTTPPSATAAPQPSKPPALAETGAGAVNRWAVAATVGLVVVGGALVLVARGVRGRGRRS